MSFCTTMWEALESLEEAPSGRDRIKLENELKQANVLLTRHRARWTAHGAPFLAWWQQQSRHLQELHLGKHLKCIIDSDSEAMYSDVYECWTDLNEGNLAKCWERLSGRFEAMQRSDFASTGVRDFRERILLVAKAATEAGDVSSVHKLERSLQPDFLSYVESSRTRFFSELSETLMGGYFREVTHADIGFPQTRALADSSLPTWHKGNLKITAENVYRPFLEAFVEKREAVNRVDTEKAHSKMVAAIYKAFFACPHLLDCIMRRQKTPLGLQAANCTVADAHDFFVAQTDARALLHSRELRKYVGEWLNASCTTRACPFHGTLMDLAQESGAWAAVCVDATAKPLTGFSARITGLSARPEYNERTCAVGKLHSNGRYAVRMHGTLLSLKPDNLRSIGVEEDAQCIHIESRMAIELYSRALSWCCWSYLPKVQWYCGRGELYFAAEHHNEAFSDGESAITLLGDASLASSMALLPGAQQALQRATLLSARSQLALGRRNEAVSCLQRALQREGAELGEVRALLISLNAATEPAHDGHAESFALHILRSQSSTSHEPEMPVDSPLDTTAAELLLLRVGGWAEAQRQGDERVEKGELSQALRLYTSAILGHHGAAVELVELRMCRVAATCQLVARCKWNSYADWELARQLMQTAVQDLLRAEEEQQLHNFGSDRGRGESDPLVDPITSARLYLLMGNYRQAHEAFCEARDLAHAALREDDDVRVEADYAERLCTLLPLKLKSLKLTVVECMEELDCAILPVNGTLLLLKIYESCWQHYSSGRVALEPDGQDWSPDELAQRMQMLAQKVDLTALLAQPGIEQLLFRAPLYGQHHMHNEAVLDGGYLDSSNFKDMTGYIVGFFISTVLARLARESPTDHWKARAIKRLVSLDCDYRVRDAMGSALTTCIATVAGNAGFGHPFDHNVQTLFVRAGGLRCAALEARDDCCYRDFFVEVLSETPLAIWQQQSQPVLCAVLEYAVASCFEDRWRYDLSNAALCSAVVALHKKQMRKLLTSLLALSRNLIYDCFGCCSSAFLCLLRQSFGQQGGIASIVKAWDKLSGKQRAKLEAAHAHASRTTSSSTHEGQPGSSSKPPAQASHSIEAEVDESALVSRLTLANQMRCHVCDVLAPPMKPFQRCGGCSAFYYCTPAHQKSHWKSGHKNECHNLKQQALAEDQRVSFLGL